jgi:hypothetical protein
MTGMKSTAVLSECGLYRYSLTREWDDGGDRCCWIMLNPSTADAEHDDPTIRKCVKFSRAWGHGSLVVVNLFAWRATDPAALKRANFPVGSLNNEAIADAVKGCSRVIAAWGNHGKLYRRADKVRALLAGVDVEHLGLTSEGQPWHPLYRPDATIPQFWP